MRKGILVFFKVFNSTVLLAITTSLLYLHGIQHRTGYFDAYGIESSLFQYSVDRTLIVGFASVFHQAIKATGPVFKIFLGAFSTAILIYALSKIPWVKQNIIPLIRTDEPQKRTLSDHVFDWFMLAVFFVVILAFIFVPVGLSYQLGNEEGKVQKKLFDSKLNAWVITDPKILNVTYEDRENDVTNKGYLIESSENIFAFYAFGKIFIVPREKLRLIETAAKLPY